MPKEAQTEIPAEDRLRSRLFRMQSIGYLSYRLAHLFERRLDEQLTPLGVNIGQMRMLFVLWELGEATQSEIARQLNIAQPTAANTLKRAARDGLVSMEPDPEHGKRILFRPTEKARQLRPELLARAEAVNRIAIESVPEQDRDQAKAILRSLGDALDRTL